MDPNQTYEWYGIKNERFYSIQIITTDNQEEGFKTSVSYGKIGGKTTRLTKIHPSDTKVIQYFNKTVKSKERDQFRSYTKSDFQTECLPRGKPEKKIKRKNPRDGEGGGGGDGKGGGGGDGKGGGGESETYNWGEIQKEEYYYDEWGMEIKRDIKT